MVNSLDNNEENINLEDDNIIRNPDRVRVVHPTERIPEYVRLGIDPLTGDLPFLDGKSINPSYQIDENDFVNFQPPSMQKTKPVNKKIPQIGEYVLMVMGRVLCSGSEEYVLSQARSVLYKEHPSFKDQNISSDDLIVFKRILLKIGVFLDE